MIGQEDIRRGFKYEGNPLSVFVAKLLIDIMSKDQADFSIARYLHNYHTFQLMFLKVFISQSDHSRF